MYRRRKGKWKDVVGGKKDSAGVEDVGAGEEETAGERERRAVRQLPSAGSCQVSTVCPTTVCTPRTVAREAPEVKDDNFVAVLCDEPDHGIRCRRGGREEKVRLFYLPKETGQEGGDPTEMWGSISGLSSRASPGRFFPHLRPFPGFTR